MCIILFIMTEHENMKAMKRGKIFFFPKSLGGNVVSRKSTSDLNPILAASNCMLNLASRGKRRYLVSVLVSEIQDATV